MVGRSFAVEAGVIARFVLLLTLISTTASAQQHWRVVIAGGEADDPRIQAVHDAVSYWNRTLADLHVPVRFGPIVRDDDNRVSDRALTRVSEGGLNGRQASRALSIDDYHADVVVFLSGADLVSYGMPRTIGGSAFIILRRGDDEPLSLPNVARNVTAHELGHVLGLDHNDDPEFLMCGRPAPCRPYAFQLSTNRIFPLSRSERLSLQRRWAPATVSLGTSRGSSARSRGSSRQSTTSRRRMAPSPLK